MHTVIIRDDDTCAFTPRACLERLYRPLLDRGLPVCLAVIPEVRTEVRTPDGRREGFLTSGRGPAGEFAPMAGNRDLADYLRAEPGFHIVQHGCHHDYLEFGSDDRRELARRLDRGAAGLREAGLGSPVAFVAPYDRMSRGALLEVAARFKVISTGWFESGRVPRRWWPAYAMKKLQGRAHWHAGGGALMSHPGCLLSFHHPPAAMLTAVQRAVDGRAVTVLVTHWWEYFRHGVPDEPFIGVLHEVGEWLASRRDIRVVSFRDVANGTVRLNGPGP
ncbi:MAG: DUF2334 domain-containing protein [Verrucomicrobia bacterium]|nr:DUF2334 domain-containing protein [Verrucomicrobiota bacterium]